MKILASIIVPLLTVAVAAYAAHDKRHPMSEPLVVTVLINESIMPVARGEKYGQPLDSYLKSLEIGELVGAGTALSPSGGPAWVEIVAEVSAPESSVESIALKLQEFGAPKGSHLYYYIGDERRQMPIR